MMSSVFISHSSRDNESARLLKEWLHLQGFTDVFLAFDKDDGILPGFEWKRELRAAMQRSQLVLGLITESWMRSTWCDAEFTSSVIMGRTFVPILIGDTSTEHRLGSIQIVDLRTGWPTSLKLLEKILDRSRVTPMAFPVAPSTPPYIGLNAYTEAEAGLFFGRELETRDLMESLRKRRDKGTQLLLICGASGAGKSSILRAGLWPQLKLRPSEWIRVCPFTPVSRTPGLNSVTATLELAIAETFRQFHREVSPASVREQIRHGLYSDILDQLRVAAGAPEAEIVFGVDQAEELLSIAKMAGTSLLEHLRNFFKSPDVCGIMTIRSDTFDHALQNRWFEQIAFDIVPIGPMPAIRFPHLIRGPASRTNFGISNKVVEAASHDADTGDALPLLSLTLHRLWLSYRGSSNEIELLQYHDLVPADLRGLITPIDDIVRSEAERALIDIRSDEDAALTDAFIPGLVDLTDAMEYVRRVARWDQMPPAARRALQLLVNARLLRSTTDIESEIRTIEVTHEALLRRWPRMRERIEKAIPELRLLKDIERAAAEWDREKRPGASRNELRHVGKTLQRAQGLRRRENWRFRLGDVGCAYLDACAAVDRRGARKRWAIGAAAAVVVIWIAAVVVPRLWIQYQNSVLQTNINDKQYDAAFETANRILEYDASNVDALVAKGSLYFYKRNFEGAAEQFELALSENSRDARIIRNLADALVETEKYERALALYSRLSMSPTREYKIGRAYVHSGRFDAAIEHLDSPSVRIDLAAEHVVLAAALAGKGMEETDSERKLRILASARDALKTACANAAEHWNAVLGKTKVVQYESYEAIIPLLKTIYEAEAPCEIVCR